LSTGEIARGTEGALKFLTGDRAAPLYFENSIEACLRSFRVMLLAAPLYALCRVLNYATVAVEADDTEIILVEGLHFVADWLLFPVLFYEIARLRNWIDRYPRYISALNWIQLLFVVLETIAAVLVLQLPPLAGDLLNLALLGFELYWFWMATRLALGTNWLFSLGLLLMNWALSYFLSLFVIGHLGVHALPGG